MFRTFINRLLDNGLLFATLFLHLLSAGITTIAILLVGIIVDWFQKHT